MALGSAQATNWIAAASAIASAVAAIFAWQGVDAAKEVPFRQVLYQAKIDALKDYRKAASEFEFDVRGGVTGLTFAGANGSVDVIPTKLSAQNAAAAKPLVEKYEAFVTAADQAGSLYDEPVHTAIAASQVGALDNARCFIRLANYNPKVRSIGEEIAANALGPCKSLMTKEPLAEFIKLSREVDRKMRAELQQDPLLSGPAKVSDTDRFLRN